METVRLEVIDDRPEGPDAADGRDLFAERLACDGRRVTRQAIRILQINVGKLCNQTCAHCHVDAGPWRTEVMTRRTMDRIIDWLGGSGIETVDVTGGAPEMNPHFEYLVGQVRDLDRRVMVRCNLTIIFEPGKQHLPGFYRDARVELVCSLPCYLEENVDRQRGRGVFEKSIRALRTLNEIGYGRADSGLVLDLVYNPVGSALPPAQDELQSTYKRELRSRYGIEFNRLWTITNMPISRFEKYLRHRGELEGYLETLMAAYNPDNVENLMCRTMLSVGWQGELYDCDFNQMLGWWIGNGRPLYLWDVDPDDLGRIPIRTGKHCFGCTAGGGSSCTGALR